MRYVCLNCFDRVIKGNPGEEIICKNCSSKLVPETELSDEELDRLNRIEKTGDKDMSLDVKKEHIDSLIGDIIELSKERKSIKKQITEAREKYGGKIENLKDELEDFKEDLKDTKNKRDSEIGSLKENAEELEEKQSQMIKDFIKGVKAEIVFEKESENETPSVTEVGKKLKRYKEENSLTWKEICDRMGYSSKATYYLSQLKNDEFDPTTERQEGVFDSVIKLLKEKSWL